MIITVLDTETTGLKHKEHEIIEIALVSYILSGEGEKYLLKEFETKIKPQDIASASPEALKVNGYSEEEWSDAPSFEEMYPQIKKIIESSDCLLGQNLIFDLNFLSSACKRASKQLPSFPMYFDTKQIADYLFESHWIEKTNLDYLCSRFGIKFEGRAHTALADCKRTMLLWEKLTEECDNYEPFTFQNPYERRTRYRKWST